MNKIFNSEETKELVDAFLCLKTKEEIESFFEDIFTINEIKSFGQRLKVAKMLTDKVSYIDIVEKTGISSATISRVNRALQYGADGYNLVLKRLSENEKD